MERDPGEFDSVSSDKAAMPISSDDMLRYSDTQKRAAEDAEAEADIAAGRTYPHEIVGEWLMTWGKPGRLPFKEWLARRNG